MLKNTNSKEQTYDSKFNESVGFAMKKIIGDASRAIVAEGINSELTKLIAKNELNSYKCTATKVNRYLKGETAVPIITLLAFCQTQKISIVDFLLYAFEAHGVNWSGVALPSSYKFSEEFEVTVFDLFEQKEQRMKEELEDCIKSRKLKSKFAYYGNKVTEKYIKLLQAEKYFLFGKTVGLLSNHVNIILERTLESKKPIRLISLGIGDGEKDSILLSQLLKRTENKVEYWVFDISLDMIKIGLDCVKRKLGKKYNELDRRIFHMDFMDIEKIFSNVGSHKQNLFLLLGNTLGNFPEDALLNKINSVMEEGDLLLLDNQLRNKKKSEAEEKEHLMSMYDAKDETEEYLYAILENAHLDKSCGNLYTDTSTDYEITHKELLNGDTIVVRHNFEITKDVTAMVDDMKIPLNKGAVIVVVYSKKYVKQALNNLLLSFFDVNIDKYCFYSTDDEYALILCEKK